METKEDRLAILRWENETVPTAERNHGSVKVTASRTAANSVRTTFKGSIIPAVLNPSQRPCQRALPRKREST